MRPFHYKLGLTWKFAQDYFSKSVGAVKKVMLTYGPTGRSRGTATIVFAKPGSAAQAAHELNGVKVDNRAMKVCIPMCPNMWIFTNQLQIEVVVGAKSVPAAAVAKSLSDRIV